MILHVCVGESRSVLPSVHQSEKEEMCSHLDVTVHVE